MKSVIKRATGAVVTGLFMLQAKFAAFAEEANTALDWLNEGNSTGDDPFSTITDKAADWGRSGYKLMMVVGGACALIFGAVAIIKIMSGDRQAKTEGKSALLWVLIGAALLGALSVIIGLCMSLGVSAFG